MNRARSALNISIFSVSDSETAVSCTWRSTHSVVHSECQSYVHLSGFSQKPTALHLWRCLRLKMFLVSRTLKWSTDSFICKTKSAAASLQSGKAEVAGRICDLLVSYQLLFVSRPAGLDMVCFSAPDVLREKGRAPPF